MFFVSLSPAVFQETFVVYYCKFKWKTFIGYCRPQITFNDLFHAGGLKSDRSSVVSSLDCLSSIVERISTDNSNLLPATDSPGSPLTDAAGEAAAPGPAQIPSPTASQDPSLIYQVL